MDKKELRELFDTALKENVEPIVGKAVAEKTKGIMEQLRKQRDAFGYDVSGLSEETKKAFVEDFRALAKGQIDNGSYKAALLESSDAAGGYLVPEEVNRGIMRVAASNGYVIRDAGKFPMGSDTLHVPRYAGSDLEGAYYTNDDTVGSETSITFGDVQLDAKTWYTIFRVSNPLLADANADVADFLIALVAEGLANKADKEGFAGDGTTFTGILEDANVTTHATSTTAQSSFGLDDVYDMIAALPASLHNKAAWYMSPTMWAHLKSLEDTAGNPILGHNNSALSAAYKIDGIKPAGVLGEYPVYLSSHFPAYSASASADTAFLAFANLEKALFFGERQGLSIAKSDSATVGGKNVFAANQTAIRATHRHAIAVGLPTAAVVAKTAAS